jgi:iron complex transport system permease protein
VTMGDRNNFNLKTIILTVFLIVLFFVSFLIGRYQIDIKTVLEIILSQFINTDQNWERNLFVVVWEVRLPRIILAILVGGALSVAGASYQTLFKNPMVSPDILGVSAGAGFGAALAMITGGNWLEIQGTAFFFGIIAVVAAYVISIIFGRQSVTVLVLAGVVVSSFFQALLSIVKTLADTDNELPSITFWLMGSLNRGTNQDVIFMLPTLGLSLLVLFFLRHHINALSAGEDVAQTMGVNVPLVKLAVIAASTFMTVSSVSICGIIGWIGMVVPHLARMITGASYSKILALSFLIGGIFLLGIDNLIRGIHGVDLPLGVLTALVGTPLFVILLSRIKQGWF